MRSEHPYNLPAEAAVTVEEGKTLTLEAVLLCCDLDPDGDIDLVDLAQLAVNMGRTGSAWRAPPGTVGGAPSPHKRLHIHRGLRLRGFVDGQGRLDGLLAEAGGQVRLRARDDAVDEVAGGGFEALQPVVGHLVGDGLGASDQQDGRAGP